MHYFWKGHRKLWSPGYTLSVTIKAGVSWVRAISSSSPFRQWRLWVDRGELSDVSDVCVCMREDAGRFHQRSVSLQTWEKRGICVTKYEQKRLTFCNFVQSVGYQADAHVFNQRLIGLFLFHSHFCYLLNLCAAYCNCQHPFGIHLTKVGRSKTLSKMMVVRYYVLPTVIKWIWGKPSRLKLLTRAIQGVLPVRIASNSSVIWGGTDMKVCSFSELILIECGMKGAC